MFKSNLVLIFLSVCTIFMYTNAVQFNGVLMNSEKHVLPLGVNPLFTQEEIKKNVSKNSVDEMKTQTFLNMCDSIQLEIQKKK